MYKQFKDQKDIKKDIELLVSQVERCGQILKKLSLNPSQEDDFINQELSISEYVSEIIKSFREISDKQFIINLSQDANSFKISKIIEIIYGIRNFIGNANKFAKKKYMFLLKVIMKLLKFQLRMMEMDIRKIFLVKLVNPILNLHLIKTIINQV